MTMTDKILVYQLLVGTQKVTFHFYSYNDELLTSSKLYDIEVIVRQRDANGDIRMTIASQYLHPGSYDAYILPRCKRDYLPSLQ